MELCISYGIYTKVSKKGGKNALDYPVGLLNSMEFDKAKGNSSGYLKNGINNWINSNNNFSETTISKRYFNFYGINAQTYYGIDGTLGVRPSVSLSLNVDILSGDGSYTNPYQIEVTE